MMSSERGRQAVVNRAADLASMVGLEGLTFGSLASETGYARSGVSSMFTTKQELQIATIAAAENIFMNGVFRDAAIEEPGLQRLTDILDRWLDYLGYFQGGCFFAAAVAQNQGLTPVREALIAAIGRIRDALIAEIALTQRLGELSSDIAAPQLAYELHAIIQEANYLCRLDQYDDAIQTARLVIGRRLAKPRH
ncbi:TetR family transcriptional regulator C-terminal domain-containing protein [Nocardia sp. NPDC101769]|uniref:TetR family transcriptional regulator C-terminal domain-containing protein n=1 Tax=Nocardia sp. NPDC101769 TaxID=3364333 RepID=UPI0037F53A7E